MTTLEKLLEQENLNNTPFAVFLSLKENIDDMEILSEICSHINFESEESFFESVKTFLLDYGKKISLGDGKEMAQQIVTNVVDGNSYRKAEESIIMTINRPAFIIRNDKIDDSIATKWKERMDQSNDQISKVIPSVGRIELSGHPRYPWVGTGWLIKGTNIVVTNRHVANIFSSRRKKSFGINTDYRGNVLSVNIDFKEEHEIAEENEFQIKKVIHVAENDEPDIALLEVNPVNEKGKSLPEGLEISQNVSQPHDNVYVVGYPAYDPIEEIKIYDFIFKGISDVKRLAPGDIFPSSAASYIYMHDCSTWYGNSGSPLVDLNTGKVVGIHYAGTQHEYRGVRANWAVRSTYLIELLEELELSYSA